MATPRPVKVGAFVLVGLTAIGLVIFLIGDERSLFESKEEYRSIFEDVEGLKRGAPVNMGGITVGSVRDVDYADDPNDVQLYVTFAVTERAQQRIRVDSRAVVAPKGLLGDKMLELTVGTPTKPVLPPGSVVPVGEKGGLFANIERIGMKADGVMTNLEKTTDSLADEQFQRDLKNSVHSMSSILESLDRGEGYGARLLHDETEAEKLSRALSNLEQTTREMNRTLRGVNSIIDRVRSGPGFAHEVVYGDAPTKTLTQFGDAAGELATTLRGVREGNGLARSVIYGDDHSNQILGNMSAVSKDLRHIVADVRAGKGTLGALLVDPSVYEDLKLLLGNVGRNRVLRALVRYSIKRDESRPGGEIRDPTPVERPETAGGADVEPHGRDGS